LDGKYSTLPSWEQFPNWLHSQLHSQILLPIAAVAFSRIETAQRGGGEGDQASVGGRDPDRRGIQP